MHNFCEFGEIPEHLNFQPQQLFLWYSNSKHPFKLNTQIIFLPPPPPKSLSVLLLLFLAQQQPASVDVCTDALMTRGGSTEAQQVLAANSQALLAVQVHSFSYLHTCCVLVPALAFLAWQPP